MGAIELGGFIAVFVWEYILSWLNTYSGYLYHSLSALPCIFLCMCSNRVVICLLRRCITSGNEIFYIKNMGNQVVARRILTK